MVYCKLLKEKNIVQYQQCIKLGISYVRMYEVIVVSIKWFLNYEKLQVNVQEGISMVKKNED